METVSFFVSKMGVLSPEGAAVEKHGCHLPDSGRDPVPSPPPSISPRSPNPCPSVPVSLSPFSPHASGTHNGPPRLWEGIHLSSSSTYLLSPRL